MHPLEVWGLDLRLKRRFKEYIYIAESDEYELADDEFVKQTKNFLIFSGMENLRLVSEGFRDVASYLF